MKKSVLLVLALWLCHLTLMATTVTSNDGKVQFLGTYAPVMLTGDNASNLYVGTDDKIYIPTEHCEVGAFSGYFLIETAYGTTCRVGSMSTSPLSVAFIS